MSCRLGGGRGLWVTSGGMNGVVRIVDTILSVGFSRNGLPRVGSTIRIPLGGNKGLIIRITRRLNSSAIEYVTVKPASNLIHNVSTVTAKTPVSIPIKRGALKEVFGILKRPVSRIRPPRARRG